MVVGIRERRYGQQRLWFAPMRVLDRRDALAIKPDHAPRLRRRGW
jgi:hypothetical protein